MHTIHKKITESLHWMFGQSVFIKIGHREIHHMPIEDILSIAKEHDLAPGTLQHLLHILSLAILGIGPLTGFIDIANINAQLPSHFTKYKEQDQIKVLHEAVTERQHHQEAALSRFSFSNPYVICWIPESEEKILEQA